MAPMAKVLPHLYIGARPSANYEFLFEQHGITHIINMTLDSRKDVPAHFTYLHIPAADVPSERLGPCFPEITAFVSSAKSQGGKALIHCQMGISRSATAVLACLIINEKMRLMDAWKLLKEVKDDVEPNPTFLRELRVLENETFGEYSLERLTVLDRCEEVKPTDWEEAIAIMLAKAGMKGSPFVTSHEECLVVISALQELTAKGQGIFEASLEKMLTVSLESFGGQDDRDIRAREALGKMITFGLRWKGPYTLGQIRTMLRGIMEGEAFKELTLDVPIAKTWVGELVEGMKGDY
jgi:atypical dual specificity phosphatase